MQTVNQATMITGGGATTWTECVAENQKAVDYIIRKQTLTLLNNSVFPSGTFIRPAFFVAFVFVTNLLNIFVRKMHNIKY